jgi:hypothetical protein
LIPKCDGEEKKKRRIKGIDSCVVILDTRSVVMRCGYADLEMLWVFFLPSVGDSKKRISAFCELFGRRKFLCTMAGYGENFGGILKMSMAKTGTMLARTFFFFFFYC